MIAYLEAENAYAKRELRNTEALQESLFQEMKGRIKEDDATVPVRYGDFTYYSRPSPGSNTGSSAGNHCTWMGLKVTCRMNPVG